MKTLLALVVVAASALFGADRVADAIVAADRFAKRANATLQERVDAAREEWDQ
jgi:hypothetical protein